MRSSYLKILHIEILRCYLYLTVFFLIQQGQNEKKDFFTLNITALFLKALLSIFSAKSSRDLFR